MSLEEIREDRESRAWVVGFVTGVLLSVSVGGLIAFIFG